MEVLTKEQLDEIVARWARPLSEFNQDMMDALQTDFWILVFSAYKAGNHELPAVLNGEPTPS